MFFEANGGDKVSGWDCQKCTSHSACVFRTKNFYVINGYVFCPWILFMPEAYSLLVV